MSKYSFETTTVGEMLDDPQILALAQQVMPQVLEHPMLDAGRDFIFADALPFFEDMVDEDALESFKEKLENLE